MKIIWRNKLLILWYRFFRSKLKKEKLIRISKKSKGVSKILYILPSEKKYAQTSSYFVKNDSEKHKVVINYLIHEKGIQYYSDSIKSNALVFSDRDFNYLGVFKNYRLINKIKSFNYHAVVDLNQSEKQTISFFIIEMNIPIKIGFKSIFSKKIYSVTIQPSSSGFIEKNYEIIQRILGLK